MQSENPNKNKKGALEFGWIFSIIVGTIILFFAFYFVYNQISQQKLFEQKVQTQGIDVLLTPFSYLGSIGSASARIATLDKESNISVSCQSWSSGDPIGYDSLITKSTYQQQAISGGIKNAYDKYLFAENMQGEKLFVLSKPLEAPWRIADLVYFFPDNKTYYFLNAPTRIKNELEDIEENFDNKHFFFASGAPEGSTRICFGSGGACDITVANDGENYEVGHVIKKNKGTVETMHYYSDSLMYGAIFSYKDLYDCNVKRLFSRASVQLELYQQKNSAILQKGCVANINLQSLSSNFDALKKFVEKQNFQSLKTNAISVNNANSNAINCRLY